MKDLSHTHTHTNSILLFHTECNGPHDFSSDLMSTQLNYTKLKGSGPLKPVLSTFSSQKKPYRKLKNNKGYVLKCPTDYILHLRIVYGWQFTGLPIHDCWVSQLACPTHHLTYAGHETCVVLQKCQRGSGHPMGQLKTFPTSSHTNHQSHT